MSKHVEKELEPFTASFLLAEFRKDVRSIDDKIDKVNEKIDNRFLWSLSIQFGTLVATLGTVITLFLTR